MDNNKIIIIGAKENNLKNISLDIDKHKFNVVTGVSGSGKSSLVFDCIYASAQSSFYETLSTYIVKNLPKINKPNVDNKNPAQTKSNKPKVENKNTDKPP